MQERKMLLLGVGLLTAFVSSAVDRYVSADGKYGEGLGECYTDLQTAVTAAQNDETVWVTNGFVCASGIGGNKSRLDVPNRRITIRSQAGLVDEAKGLGATIKGPGAACAEADQARCVNSAGSSPIIIGLVLEDGYPNGYGGGVNGACTLKNCVIRNCKGTRGGGVYGASCEGCVITNNMATAIGGGASMVKKLVSCTIAHNRVTGYGGGIGTWDPEINSFYTNCWFYANFATAQGGGIAMRDKPGPIFVVGCVISNNCSLNTGGGCYAEQRAVKMMDCDIVENVVTNNNGGGLGGCVAADCRILRNMVVANLKTCSGAGAYDSMITNCVVSCNSNCCISIGNYGMGGGASKTTAVGCLISENYAQANGGGLDDASTAIRCLVRDNISDYRAGGMNGGVSQRCVFTNNYAKDSGGGTWGGKHYNDLYIGNRAGGIAGAAAYSDTASCVFNCTFVGNSGTKGHGFHGIGTAVNCVSWENVSTVWDMFDKADVAVSNCCCAATPQAPAVFGNIVADPKFRTIGGKDYYVGNKDCKNASLPFDWMTDANDARSKDVYGNARVIGTAADLGAVESKIFGLSVLVR